MSEPASNLEPLAGLAFHHLGIACADINEEIGVWAALGYRAASPPFVDVAQGVRGLFMIGGGPRVELLEANEGSKTLEPWLKRRVKIYHSGYIVRSLSLAMTALEAKGATVALAPMHSAYFESPIAFLLMSNLALIELIEAAPDTLPESPGAMR